MTIMAYIAMFVFVVLMAAMSWTTGTQNSISALARNCRLLLCGALWAQVLLLPAAIEVTPESWKWLAFLGVSAIVVCGGANVFDKADEKVHIIAAVAAFTLLTGWVMVVNSVCLLPLIVCIACGRERWKWRTEVGLIISVYMALITKLGITL